MIINNNSYSRTEFIDTCEMCMCVRVCVHVLECMRVCVRVLTLARPLPVSMR